MKKENKKIKKECVKNYILGLVLTMKKIIRRIERAIVKGTIFIYCKIVYRVKIVGLENVPKKGSVLFCANHRSFLDAPLLEVTCKRDDTRFLAKEELAKNPFMAYLGKVFNVILVKRNDRDLGPMKESLKTLKDNQCIALFPEGTRNGLKKGIKPKTGVAYFALNSDAKVIPVGIKGGEKPFRKTVITYGKPLELEEYKSNKKDKEIVQVVTDKIMENIINLTD